MADLIDLTIYTEYMSRLEALVRTLVGGRFQTAQELWTIQTDLLDLQVEIAESIGEQRQLYETACIEQQTIVAGKEVGWQIRVRSSQAQQQEHSERLAHLEHALAKARSFGDAFAWTLLGGNERLVRPLSENARVGSVPDLHARTGVLVIAQEWAKNGAGFPVLHDITNILRVGDITFVGKGQNAITVEVKTHYEGETDSLGTHNYTVQVWGEESQVRPFTTSSGNRPDSFKESRGKARLERSISNPRLRRQLDRMRIAHQTQRAQAGDVMEIGDARALVVEWERNDGSTHWKVVRQLAAKAKDAGSASAALDDALFCAAFYTDPPIHLRSKADSIGEWFSGIPEELANCGIFYQPPLTDKNGLWFSVSLAYDHDSTALHHLPFLRYPLDEEHIVDMLWGRLWFFVALNVGKVIEHLEQRGFEVEFPDQRLIDVGGFLNISRSVSLPDGSVGRLEVQNSRLFASKMLYEFLSLEGFGNLIEAVSLAGGQAVASTLNAQPPLPQ